MCISRFDTIARRLAERRSSRHLVQGATPSATPMADGERTNYLFVQSFQSGTIARKDGSEGTYTLTLEQGLGQTIYFSDRPERIVGMAPTPDFFDGLGFGETNPPNSALVVDSVEDGAGFAVIELYNPSHDEATGTATYDVSVLEGWEDTLGMGLTEAPADLGALPQAFGSAHLFIDDCPDARASCTDGIGGAFVGWAGTGGTCWDWMEFECVWCDQVAMNQRCNASVPKWACNNQDCWANEVF